MRRLHGLLVLLAGTTACELITGAGDLTIRERSDAGSADASADVATEGAAPNDDAAIPDAASEAGDASDSGQPNVCLAAGCDPKASCSSADAGIVCQCPSGYTTPDVGHTCVDVDECLVPNRCGAGGTCQNVAGGFTCTCPVGGCSVVFGAFGTYEFMVPSGVADITVDVWGAGGGASVGNNVFGGAGGYTFGHLAAPAGTTLDVLVGQAGYAGVNNGNAPGSFGGGGGAGNYGGGGGGRSAVSSGATPYFVAGGGGGAGYHTGNTTGAGGGLVGGNTLANCGGGGLGGSQGAGGGGGPGATAGVSGIGGSGTQNQSGGGGGGYFGGGGGGNDCGGGGGSGYYRGSAPVSAATSTAGTAETPAGTERPTYGGNAGRGGAGVKFQATWNAGVDGRVVFTWQ